MTQGTRVRTPLGPGTVVYVRYDHLAPANAPMAVAAASVMLDHLRQRPGYAGTVFPAAQIDAEAGR